jgi:hypothetical protein
MVTMSRRLIVVVAGAALLTLACGDAPMGQAAAAAPSPHRSPAASPTTASTPSPAPAPTATPAPPTLAPAPSLDVVVTGSDYGFLAVSTAPGASCAASAVYSNGKPVSGLGGPRSADARGSINWTYPQPPVKGVTGGVYTINCSVGALKGSTTARFQVGD